MTWHTFGPWWFSNKSCPWTGPSPFQREMERIRIHRRGVGNFFRECNHYVTSRVLTTTPIPASSVSANTAPVQFVSYLSPFFFWSGGVDLQHSSARFSFKRCSGIFSACNGLKSRPDFDQWAEHYHQVHWEKNMKTRQRYHMLVHWHL